MQNTIIQRWGILFPEYGVKIRYQLGKNNVHADLLSRIRSTEVAILDSSTEWVELDNVSSPPILADDLDKQDLQNAQKDEFPEEWQTGQEADSGYTIYQKWLYSVNRPNQSQAHFPRLIFPKLFRDKIISICHMEAAHAGLLKTLLKIQGGYVWTGMKKDIKKALEKCPQCLVHNSRPEQALMGEMPVAQSPGQIVSMDLIGSLVISEQGNRFSLVMIDHWSGWIEVYPLSSKSNTEVWHKLHTDYFPMHGAPQVLISDQGSEFKSKEFEESLRSMRVGHQRTTPWHPQLK